MYICCWYSSYSDKTTICLAITLTVVPVPGTIYRNPSVNTAESAEATIPRNRLSRPPSYMTHLILLFIYTFHFRK